MHLIRAQCLPVRLLTTLLLAALAAEAIPQPRAAAGLNELEARFQKQMSGAKMLGFYTVSDAPAGVPAREESYTIQRVTKLGKDRWRFDARIEYDKRSVEMPVVVEVRWAGDTPMIQVTDMKIPMLGTYTARVLIYRGQYAGMWSGKGHGGHMYGRIVPAAGQEAGPDGNTKDKEVRGASLRAPGKTAWWNAWRGRDGTGVARGSNPPTEWSEDRNIRWKAAIPGLGSSSPIVWKDRVYVTTAIETDELGEPSAGRDPPEPVRRRERRGGRGRRGGRRGGFMNRPPPTRIHEFVVLALDRRDGEIVWRTEVKKAVPHEAGHRTSSQASNSPVTDGEHIYAYFGSRGLHCLDMEGNVQWSKDFGLMRTRMGFGEGSSPALHGDTLVINWDHEGDSFVVALDKRSGKERWRRARDEHTSWSTPLVVEVSGHPQVIISATGASRAYDLENGHILWSLDGMTMNCIPSPVHAAGIVYLMSGFRGSALQAIRLAGAKGDLRGSDNILWTHGRNTSYAPSALLYDGFLYFLRSNNGVLTCLDAETGEVHYEGQRLDGIRTIYSSPVGANGRVYLSSRTGTTKVIKLGPVYEELATNRLDDGFDASMAIVGDEIYLRGMRNLYCIAER